MQHGFFGCLTDARKEFIMERALETFKYFDRPLELGHPAVLPLAQARGASVHSLRGTRWVTQEGDREDYFVRAGESFRIEHDGVTLVSAPQGAGTVLITRPAARPHPQRDGILKRWLALPRQYLRLPGRAS
jgi:DUF2917 family protein